MRPTAVVPLPDVELPTDLAERVLRTVHDAQFRRVKIRFYAVSAVFVACLALTAARMAALVAELRASAVSDYSQFMFTDADIVFSNASAYVWGILEFIPLGFVILVLIALFLLIGTVTFAQAFLRFRHAPMIRIHKSLGI